MAERRVRKTQERKVTEVSSVKAVNRKISKIFIGLGIAFILIVIVIITAALIYNIRGSMQDKESKAYIDQAVPVIVAHWDKHQLEERADSQLLAATTPDQINEIFNGSAKGFGPMVKYVGSNGESGVNFNFDNGKFTATTTAIYTAHVLFKKKYIDIKVNLIKRDDKWYIYGFFVDPPSSSY